MIKITLNSQSHMTPDQMTLFEHIFAELSRRTLLCREKYSCVVPEYIRITNEDLNDENITYGPLGFLHAVRRAMQTTVTISVDTVEGQRIRTVPLFAGYVEHNNEDNVAVSWQAEPEFTISSDNGDIKFRFFDGLQDLIESDVDYDGKEEYEGNIEWCE